MSVLNRELVFLILQYLDEEDLTKTKHMLERETRYFFDLEYFKDLLMNGTWDEAENYLGSFTQVEDNKYSTKIYFDIRKQKFLEALDEQNFVKALDILKKDLKVFRPGNKQLFKDIGELFTLDDIRDHELLGSYTDASLERRLMADAVLKVLKANPLLKDKLHFPEFCSQRLKCLVNQGLNWQHLLCRSPLPNPQVKTLLEDHVCGESIPSNSQSSQTDLPSSLDLSMSFQSPAISSNTSSTIGSQGAPSLGRPISTGAVLNAQKISNVTEMMQSESLNKVKSSDISPTDVLADFPKSIARTLTDRSSPVSMDFHPVDQTTLLVGTSTGEIGLWDIISSKKLLSRNFKVWDIAACSLSSQAALVSNPSVMVTRIMWYPDGSLFAVAFSKHLVQLYSYNGGCDARRHLEIDAHVGGVNDIAFSKPHDLCFLITCGHDKLVKVWDVLSGTIAYNFEGHDAPVYSVCCHMKESIHFIFSISMDGNLKAWLYDDMGARINTDVNPCHMKLAYSANGERLFSWGTDKDGQSFISEWTQNQGTVMRTYQGLEYHSPDALHFDTTKNQFLAAGDEYVIKIWDMNDVKLLTSIQADGCLTERPVIRFNKEGSLLAATAIGNNIKILASGSGLLMLQNSDSSSNILSEVGDKTRNTINLGIPNSISAKQCCVTTQTLSEISESSLCVSLWLPSRTKKHKISKLTYTSCGTSIFALTLSGVHLCWRWPKSSDCMAPITVLPELVQPKDGQLLTNEFGTNMDEALPCFALTRNDSYVISASSGGQLSLFNMVSLKRMLTLKTPPGATCVAFHPLDNNIVAIGMMDSTILIYHVLTEEIMETLTFHEEKITSIAFSSILNVLVSLGADAQIIIWKIDGWELQEIISLTIPSWERPGKMSETKVQFHQDQRHLLVIHESFLAIYDVMDQQCVNQWINQPLSAPIAHATFSCDSQLIYASFLNGHVYIFISSDLQPQCCIKPSAFLPAYTSYDVYPVVIAAHPKQPYRSALGLSNGDVCIIEPPETAEKWPISMN